MLVHIKHILIEVNALKVGYIVRIDGMFGTIVDIKEQTATVEFTDGTRNDRYLVEELKCSIVKFLAIMKDLNSFPIIHSDFISIIHFFGTKELVKEFVDGSKDFTVDGNIQTILTHPKIDDVVELTSLKVADKQGMTKDRAERIGIIVKGTADMPKNMFAIRFPTKTIRLKRSEFDILSRPNSKQVFKTNDK